MIFSILHFIYNLTDGAEKNKNPKRTLLKKIQLKGRTFNCAVEFHHQGQGSEYLNTTPEAVQRLRKVLILSEHYDHHDYSDTLSITRPVITLYPFIPVRLPFSSTSLTLSLSCRQTGTHAQTHAHTCTQTHRQTVCAWVSAAPVAADWNRGRPHPAIIPRDLFSLKAVLWRTEWQLNGRPAGSLQAGEESDKPEGEHTQRDIVQAHRQIHTYTPADT